MRDAVLASNTPWMCVSCYYCAVRCPQEVHIPDVMYGLKSIAAREGRSPESAAPDFSRTFIANIRRYGRSYEVGLVARHYLRHFPLRLPGMAPAGLRHARERPDGASAPPDPGRRRPAGDPRPRASRRPSDDPLLYYPGCSMNGTAMGYASSMAEVAGPRPGPGGGRGLELLRGERVLPVGPLQGYALVARNLALAEREEATDHTVVAPCSSSAS